jgi:TetR/AcrR family transcriptional repressor of nem operon
MGGPKQYDRTELLDKAFEVFRRDGFHGTSTATLVDQLDVNRKTMYAEFGSKQGLFEATLERYGEQHLSRVLAPIEQPSADAESIRQAFAGYGRASGGWARGLGCLMCNTAVEGGLDPGIRRYVDGYLDRLQGDFRQALVNARGKGQIAEDADIDDLAAFLARALIGVSVAMRAEASEEQVQAACRIAMSVVDADQPAAT